MPGTKTVPTRTQQAPARKRAARKTPAPAQPAAQPVVTVDVDLTAIQRAATMRRAAERLGHIEEMRDAFKLSQKGMAQREIADTLGTTQPRVHRMLKSMERRANGGRDVDEATPEELILRANVSHSSRQALVKALSRLHYTFRQHAPGGVDGAVPGTWDQVHVAYLNGLLSKKEFERVAAAVNPPRT